jgi:predicted ATP-grasp superfamily ATP-dependent carboligase
MKILIFSGYNPRAIISFCRIATEYDLDFDIIAKSEYDEILKTDYSKFVKIIRTDKNIDIQTIIKIVDNYDNLPLFILPSTEYINRILIDNQSELYKKNVSFGLVDKSIYKLISDKKTFANLCNEHDISIPEEYATIPSKFPYVVKPKKYFGTNGIISTPSIIYNNSELDFYFLNKNLEDFYFQEFVNGESIYILFYFNKNSKDINVYSQKNYIQQSNGGSIIYAKSSDNYLDPIVRKLIKMFNNVGFFGLVMVEFRKTLDDWIMIEANPRLWGPSQLILDSGMDLLDNFLYDNKLIDKINFRKYTTNVEYIWSGGIKSSNIVYHDGCENYEYNLKFDIYNHRDTIKLFTNE